MTLSKHKAFAKTILFSSVLAANGVLAAELEEIVVTAQKRAENLQDTPLSIEAMSADDITNKGVSDVSDLFKVVPGVVGYEGPSSRGNISVNMRGVGSGNPNTVSLDPANALYIDGIFLGKASGNGVDAMDLERVEVLKGPQGTLYGRNSTGGAINFITKKPQDEFGLKLKATAGNFGAQNLNARVDLPVTDTLSLALSGYSRERDELYDNTRAGGEGFENIDRSGFRFAAQWEASDNLTVNYSFANDELAENSQMFDVVGFNPMGAGVLNAPGFPNQVGIGSTDRIDTLRQFQGGLGFLPQTPEVQQLGQWIADNIDYATGELETASARSSRGSNDERTHSANDVDAHSLTLAWAVDDFGAFGDVEFKSITGIREVANLNAGDLDGIDNSVDGGVIGELPLLTIGGLYFNTISPFLPAAAEFAAANSLVQAIQARGAAPIFNNFATIEHEQFSQELQMVGSVDTLDYALGVYYYDDESVFRNNRAASFPVGFTATSSHDLGTEAWSVFAQATWSPSEESPWAITGGLRYTEETKDIEYLWRSSENPASFFGGPVENNYVANELAETQPEVAGVFGRKFSEDFSNVSGKVTVQYFFSDDLNVFATYSTGYRSGGFNGDFFDNINDTADAFDEETIQSYELGLKSTLWDGQAQFNATVFAYQYDDLQVSTLLPQANGSVTSSISNAGSTQREGLELSGKIAATDNLVLGMSYTYINGDFDDFPSVDAPNGVSLDTSSLAERGLAPDNQITLSLDWNIYEGDSGYLDLSLNGSWQQESVPLNISTGVYDVTSGDGTNPDTPVVFQQASLDERTMLGGRLAWTSEMTSGNLTVALWGSNLLDDEHRTFGFNYGPALGLNLAQYGAPRTYGLDVIWEM